ncbi:mitochondrial ribosomal protein L23 [Epithele typhae]|uniref:mitochondrial ribosomal protein L23 n=1 Tax=Epithele typhae TaxID=378194 RepID=UPI002007CDF5|nr:mitochondrial ribosomal protein L23 [Epithele typhae]KAH9926309.1 mitochondrial ribosomal protein L23 [Epithele typhae]
MFPTLRRLSQQAPDLAKAARSASTPMAIRARRDKKGIKSDFLVPDTTVDGLSPSEMARYQRHLATGELFREDGTTPTPAEWLAQLHARRNRLRGIKEVVREDGTKATEVVGQKVYLPNIRFVMTPNHTPPGQPYNPYEATFRVPREVTKTDVRSYLLAAYGVRTTYIRTSNYQMPVKYAIGTRVNLKRPTFRTYKRAVVGLVDPFFPPEMEDDMSAAEREERAKVLRETFQAGAQDSRMRAVFLKNSNNPDWKKLPVMGRGHIVRSVAARKAERREAVEKAKADMLEKRAGAEAVAET